MCVCVCVCVYTCSLQVDWFDRSSCHRSICFFYICLDFGKQCASKWNWIKETASVSVIEFHRKAGRRRAEHYNMHEWVEINVGNTWERLWYDQPVRWGHQEDAISSPLPISLHCLIMSSSIVCILLISCGSFCKCLLSKSAHLPAYLCPSEHVRNAPHVSACHCYFMLCYMDICIAPLAEIYSEALSAWQAGEKKRLQTT